MHQIKDVTLEFIEVEKLIPHENFDYDAIILLISKISKDGFWRSPVVIDKKTQIIMDGHHRVEVAKRMGVKNIPCYLMNYGEKYIDVLNWHTNEKFDVNSIFETVRVGKKFPVKTTRHIFLIPLYNVKIDLNMLII
ncbi:ParB N-terminal domain-containing protein [Fluviispira sanaruensis]|uniref:Transcriptional regulator n=1 Tax=Fluviispira sanaruensis TaxID=2493639 RepID=A0A4P2VLP7_FLUSA|nr:ParB N-terminal domain-containing protein [Fluviispira sanaruensis]BBH54266.1 transcriptional regulator [Fluviispira sanaruensis]